MSKEFQLLKIDVMSQLVNHVVNNDHESIKRLVRTEGVKILHMRHEDYEKPILHIALDDKSEQVLPTTIQCLMSLDADICKPIAEENEPIHSAVNGQNPRLLETIVNSIQSPVRLNATAMGNTALNLLVKHGNKNSNSFMECLHILLNAGIDVNKHDKKPRPPILWACVKGYKDVIEAILECGRYVDIDTHKYEGKTARNYIQQHDLFDGNLNAVETNENIVRSALWYVENKDEEGFFKLRGINVNDENEEGTLLQHACNVDLVNVVKYLVDHNDKVDVAKTTPKNKMVPLEIAAYNGYDKIFKILLPKYKPIPGNILTTLMINTGLFKEDTYKKCLDALLDNEKLITINERSRSYHTPLHYSDVLNDPNIQLKLLKKGASLANKNEFGSIPITNIDSKTLEQHFDDCIATEISVDRQGINVIFDYTTILPTFEKTGGDVEMALIEEPINEINVIRTINETPELRHLLIHPLIASFVHIKWHRMCWFFWINLTLCVVFTLFFFIYAFVPADNSLQNDLKLWVDILWKLLVVTYIMLFLRELSKLILSYRTYCCSLSNILKVGMLIACFYSIFYKSTDMTYKQFCSVAMVLLALELMVLGAQYPRLSTYMVMLRTVTKNFFFFLLWYAILIFAFALSFYVLYNKNGSNQNFTNSTDVEDKKCENNDQPFFNKLGMTIIKTIVMMTGELDASSINFDSFWNRVIFLLFVFIIPIILYNLLNGLAINDTQEIRSVAEIIGYAERVSYIVYLGNVVGKPALLSKNGRFFRKPNFNLIHKSLAQKVSLTPDYLHEKRATVSLYHDGLVIENIPKTKGYFDKLKRVHLDKETVKRVKQILYERNAKLSTNKRIENLRHIIDIQNYILKRSESKTA